MASYRRENSRIRRFLIISVPCIARYSKNYISLQYNSTFIVLEKTKGTVKE
jgi:hypothetical protein